MQSLSIVSAYLLDLIFGDPPWFPHPVKGIGRIITFFEGKINHTPDKEEVKTNQRKQILRLKGVIFAVIVVGGCAFIAYLFLGSLKRISPHLETVAWVFLAYTSLATKDLFLHAKQILTKLKGNNIEEARQKLSLIVGRDTKSLSKEKIISATIESIAESTNDGIIAPLFYLILGGPILAISYKAINTLDSMVGHKNERYLHFGWFSARLDDLANFIPARISGLLIVISSLILGNCFQDSFKIMYRDGNKHPSPNSGVPQAAMAGALGIKLGGPSVYEGELLIKSYIGEEKNPLQLSLINKALMITFLTSFLMVAMGAFLKWAI